MENKINIAELLKDCPKGIELYSPLCGECEFVNIINDVIYVESSLNKALCFNSLGMFFEWYEEGECLLFPSKEQRDWSKFQRPFKDGDILISGEGKPFIFKQINSFGNAECYCAINCYGDLIFNSDNWTPIKGCRLANEEEKQKLFDATKDKGYIWNEETNTLDKLPKFKVGDRIVKKGGLRVPFVITGASDVYYWSNTENSVEVLPVADQDDWELVPNKFDVTTLKPFESKVLVRDTVKEIWKPDFFGCLCDGDYCSYMVVGGIRWKCCIPFEGNEHLLGKTDDCDEFYKNWE